MHKAETEWLPGYPLKEIQQPESERGAANLAQYLEEKTKNEQHLSLRKDNSEMDNTLDLPQQPSLPVVRDLSYSSELKSEEAESQPEEKVVQRRTVVRVTFWRGLKFLLSFTYGASLPIMLYMWGRVRDSNGNNTDGLDAGSHATTTFDLGVNLVVVPSYMISSALNLANNILKNPASSPEQKAAAKDIFSRSIKIAMVFTLPLIVTSNCILYFSNFFLVSWFGQEETVAELAQEFLRPSSWLMWLYAWRFILQAIFYVHDQETLMMIISLVGFISFDIVLMIGFDGQLPFLPSSSIVRGMVNSIWCENLVTTGLVTAFLFQKKFRNEYHFWRSFLHWTPADTAQFKEFASYAITQVLTYLSELGTLFVKNILAGLLGKEALDVQALAGQVSFFELLIAAAFALATAINVSDASTQANKIRFARYGLLTAVVVGAVPAMMVIAYPQMLVVVDGGASQDVASLAQAVVPLSAATSVINVSALTMLRSLGMTGDSRKYIIPMARFNGWLWVGVFMGYLFGFTGKMGVLGINLASLISTGIGTFDVSRYFRKEYTPPPPAATPAPTPASPSVQVDSSGEPIRASSSWGSWFSPSAWRRWYYSSEAILQPPSASNP